ncbi:hypothetical protein QLX08_003747 [Tetragonisca angustula]|uniref:Uncharacterized protein n=1 Tax=Tetragonisca angustula TaxID=166442 RepID=A0AAW1A539_9HYME
MLCDRWEEIEQSASTAGTKGEDAETRTAAREEGRRIGDGGAAASGEAEGRRRRRRCSGGSEERRCSPAMADRGWRYARDV